MPCGSVCSQCRHMERKGRIPISARTLTFRVVRGRATKCLTAWFFGRHWNDWADAVLSAMPRRKWCRLKCISMKMRLRILYTSCKTPVVLFAQIQMVSNKELSVNPGPLASAKSLRPAGAIDIRSIRFELILRFPELSNLGCLPGRAGGLPFLLANSATGDWQYGTAQDRSNARLASPINVLRFDTPVLYKS